MAFTSLACFHGRMTSWFNSLPCVSWSPRIKPWFNSFLHSEACCLGFVFSEVLNQSLIPPHCSAAVAAAPVWRGQPWNRNLFQFSTGEVEVGSQKNWEPCEIVERDANLTLRQNAARWLQAKEVVNDPLSKSSSKGSVTFIAKCKEPYGWKVF